MSLALLFVFFAPAGAADDGNAHVRYELRLTYGQFIQHSAARTGMATGEVFFDF